MASYNGEEFIKQQIESILVQLSSDDELIISDDGSNDATCDIIGSFDDERIRLITNPLPGSPVRNFEHALKHVRGNLIFLSDQDDLWEPHKVRIQAGLLEFYDLVVSDCFLIDSTGSVTADSFYNLRGSGPGFLKNLYINSFLGCCMAFRRSIILKALPFPSGIAMHDIWIGLITELFGTTFFCPDKLVRYRRHNNSATQTCGTSSFSFTKKISYRWHLLYSAVCRKNSIQ